MAEKAIPVNELGSLYQICLNFIETARGQSELIQEKRKTEREVEAVAIKTNQHDIIQIKQFP